MSLKPVIKSAREALDRKDYEYCLQLCNDALAFEPDNYFLLIFKAVALFQGPQKDTETALKTYSLAGTAHPDKELAFQGIINVYESTGKTEDALYDTAITGLLAIYLGANQPQKHFELSRKRLQSTVLLKTKMEVLDWFRSPQAVAFYSADFLKQHNLTARECLLRQIALLEEQEARITAQELDSARSRLGAESPALIKSRVQLDLYRSNRLNELYQALLEIEPENAAVAETLISRLFRLVLARQKQLSALTPLLDTYSSNLTAKIKSNLNEEEGAKSEAIAEDTSTWPMDFYFALQRHYEQAQFDRVFALESDFLALLDKWKEAFGKGFDKTRRQFSLLKLACLAATRQYSEALAFQQLNGIGVEDLLAAPLFDLMLSAFEEEHCYTQAITLIESKLADYAPETPVLILRLVDDLLRARRVDEAAQYASAVLESYPDAPPKLLAEAHFYCGVSHWVGNPGQTPALDCLLRALKADAENDRIFLYLGKIYSRSADALDLTRAKKCAAKALQLNPANSEAPVLLAEILLKDRPEPQAKAQIKHLLAPLAGNLLRSRRLFYYMGLAESELGNDLAAATHFQAALKGNNASIGYDDPSDPKIEDHVVILRLATAYWRSGRLASAEKAFQKCLSFPQTNSAVVGASLMAVQMDAKLFLPAMETFSTLANPDAETMLCTAELLLLFVRESARVGRFHCCRRVLRRVVESLSSLALEAFGWRCLGEAFALCHEYGLHLEGQRFPFRVNPGLADVHAKIEALPESILKCSALCAITALSAAKENHGRYWLEAAYAFHRLGLQEYTAAACRSSLKSLRNRKLAAKAHHLLSLIHADNAQHRQHHLVRSLQLDEGNPATWLDLARLYAAEGEQALAVEACGRALQIDPECHEATWTLSKLNSLPGMEDIALQLFSARPVALAREICELVARQTPATEASGAAARYLKGWLGADGDEDCDYLLKIDLLDDSFWGNAERAALEADGHVARWKAVEALFR